GNTIHGHGIYFAEHPDVAKHYAEYLSKDKKGNVYKVKLEVEKDKLLDSNIALEKQNEHVKGALQKAFPDDFKNGVYVATPHVLDGLGAKYGEAEVAKRLDKAGVHGITYLDAQSRDLGAG